MSKRRTGALMALAAAAALVITVFPAPLNPAQADPPTRIGLEGFDQNFLLSDVVLDDAGAMTREDVTAFLADKGSKCVVGSDGSPCLRDAIFDVSTVPTPSNYCEPMTPGEKTAADVIFEVSQACGINARVLLVMLQKEQGLVTTGNPTQEKYDKAMGAGCPDGAECDPAVAGFVRQLYSGASRLNGYRDPANVAKYQFQAGITKNVKYHPKTECGTTPVYFTTAATAALYTYTPYVPNEAALAAIDGLGDSCSSYGNRNFFRIYSGWFGQPPNLVARLAAEDRYATAARISRANFQPNVPTVYLASGTSYVDALAVAPVAGTEKAPLLLTAAGELPTATSTELQRLRPERIVLIGGDAAISSQVAGEVARFATVVERIEGPNRYATAAAISERHEPGVATVYLASGANPADALSIAPVAGTANAPVLLTAPTHLPVETAAALERLAPQRVVIVGGEGAINQDVAAHVGKLVANAERLAGTNRYDTAAQIAAQYYTGVSNGTVYLASGVTAADALAVAPLAGAQGVPVLLSRPEDLPGESAAALDALYPLRVVIVGGTAAISEWVEIVVSR